MDYDLTRGRTYMYAKDKPLYPFGYGLSYTTFSYEGLNLSAPSVAADGVLQVTVKVKNTGQRASDEVVQMYVQHLGTMVDRPKLELKGFQRVRIDPGEEKSVTLDLKPRDLAYWDQVRHAWRVEKEQVRVLAGSSSDTLPVQATLTVTGSREFKP
jgi:beta-glucosidase